MNNENTIQTIIDSCIVNIFWEVLCLVLETVIVRKAFLDNLCIIGCLNEECVYFIRQIDLVVEHKVAKVGWNIDEVNGWRTVTNVSARLQSE